MGCKMRVALKKMLGTVPAVIEQYKMDEYDEDGFTVARANFVVVNPCNENKVRAICYAYTLLPFREDMIVPVSELQKYVGLNHPDNVMLSPASFELEKVTDALDFFRLPSGAYNPMMLEWVRSPQGQRCFSKFMETGSAEISIYDRATIRANPVVALLHKCGFIKEV